MIEPPSDSEPFETGKRISACVILIESESNNHDAPLFVTLPNRVGNNSHRSGKSSLEGLAYRVALVLVVELLNSFNAVIPEAHYL